MYLPPAVPAAAAEVLLRQAGVATRVQLQESGLTEDAVRAQVDARRWSTWGSHVVLAHNAEATRSQLQWAAVLDAGRPAALCSHSALELAGFRSWSSEATLIHLLVPRGHHVLPHPLVVVHESRRVRADLHLFGNGPPRTDPARSTIDAATWQRWPRFACAMVAAAVQQRVATADDLDAAMRYVGRVRHKAYLREAIRDVRGGSEALGEMDLLRLCRRHGLEEPRRQVRRRDSRGRWRYLDAMWQLPDGRTVVLEVDGAHHFDVSMWADDMRRDREVVVAGAVVLRATNVELRVEPSAVVADLIAIGVPTTDLSAVSGARAPTTADKSARGVSL